MHSTVSRRTFVALAAASALPAVHAQAFPSRPISWVVPYPSGGFGDALSRLLAQKMQDDLKQTVIVDNRPGAGAQIAAAYVKQQPADGHTVLYGDIGPFAMNAALYAKLSYDTLADFTPLTRLFTTPLVLVVPANSPYATLADLVKAAQADKTKGLSYGSYGVGSQPHVWTEMFRRQTSTNLVHIPYKGAAPALQDLIAGRLDLMCDVSASSIPFVRDGKIKALAVIGSERRLAQLPAVPTLAEVGYGALNIPGWNGAMVRVGTPPAVVARLHQSVVAALQSPDIVARYSDLGLAVATQTPQQFGDYIRAESARWGGAIKEAGIQVE